jgi:hypothetical protein
VSASDSLTLSDNANASVDFSASVADSLNLVDEETTRQAETFDGSLSDRITLTDSFEATVTYSLSVEDTLQFTDSTDANVTPTPPEPPPTPTIAYSQDDSAELNALFKKRAERERKANAPAPKSILPKPTAPTISPAIREENRRRMAILMELMDV